MGFDIIQIDWGPKQRSVDYFKLGKPLAPAEDVGPLIFLPERYAGMAEGASSKRPPVMRFDGFRDLRLHIYMEEPAQDYNFWCGVCGLLPENEKPFAEAVMDQLVNLLDQSNNEFRPLTMPFMPQSSRTSAIDIDIAVEPPVGPLRSRVMNSGCGFPAVSALHDWIIDEMIIIRN